MKLILFACAIFAVMALMVSCKHQKYTPETLPEAQIRFGKGGGITGMEHSYTLLENGQLFQDGKVEMDSAKRRIAKTCFKAVEKLGLAKLDFQHPGNTYSFIEVPAAGGFKRISWGGREMPVDPAVSDLFNKLMGLVPQNKN